MATFDGIDVSKYQGTIDWAKVRGAGIRFAILRAGIGGSADSMLKTNLAGCTAEEIPFGFYHFCKSTDAQDAKEEGAAFLKTISGAKPEYPIFCDIELSSQTALPRRSSSTSSTPFLRRHSKKATSAASTPLKPISKSCSPRSRSA
jgi:GH25 family lysozyme M1 (1,4-beta-N-acetylmuramidase)